MPSCIGPVSTIGAILFRATYLWAKINPRQFELIFLLSKKLGKKFNLDILIEKKHRVLKGEGPLDFFEKKILALVLLEIHFLLSKKFKNLRVSILSDIAYPKGALEPFSFYIVLHQFPIISYFLPITH